MDLRLPVIMALTLSAVLMKAVESSVYGHTRLSIENHAAFLTRPRIKCGGGGGSLIGDCNEEELLMESEMSRRVLAQSRYISYSALAADSIPCRRRGNSYYNCASHKQVNPYLRGCSAITHCARG